MMMKKMTTETKKKAIHNEKEEENRFVDCIEIEKKTSKSSP